jgi:hypothetical protein
MTVAPSSTAMAVHDARAGDAARGRTTALPPWNALGSSKIAMNAAIALQITV